MIMEYQGKLYGKVGKHYLPMMQTTEDFDNLTKQRDELIECLKLAYENLSGNTEEKVFSKIEELLTKTQTQ